ncbi:uncharacterized protein LAJ45_04941 [Morchella importuna]|uniref:uncharacterized protein n=1 Tax=Morchella importuna TaxID=1174673 RepID=UPI001E8CE3C3|nr:uncharacterized protein LAJ45_04941 [Morchella importuna]KAH8150762.1 hypothetical protein LAJ45_04941 [Morchella importuna]
MYKPARKFLVARPATTPSQRVIILQVVGLLAFPSPFSFPLPSFSAPHQTRLHNITPGHHHNDANFPSFLSLSSSSIRQKNSSRLIASVFSKTTFTLTSRDT